MVLCLPQSCLKPRRKESLDLQRCGQCKQHIIIFVGLSVWKDLLKYRLTVFTSLDIQDIAPDTIPSLGVGQHLDAVVGEFLQAPELDLLLDGCDVLHFTPL